LPTRRHPQLCRGTARQRSRVKGRPRMHDYSSVRERTDAAYPATDSGRNVGVRFC
jgi:hypothetical protein